MLLNSFFEGAGCASGRVFGAEVRGWGRVEGVEPAVAV